MASKTTATDTNARNWEYGTYAPRGEKCRRCGEPFTALERCRRVKVNRRSGDTEQGLYEHPACPADKPTHKAKQ